MSKKRELIEQHYETLENLSYTGMVFWFVPFIFAIASLQHNPNLVYNPFLDYFLIMMFLLHFLSSIILFDDDRLYRWIKRK